MHWHQGDLTYQGGRHGAVFVVSLPPYLTGSRGPQRVLHWTAGGIDVFLISTAITPNKIIAGVVLLVVVLAAAGFWMSRRRRG